jgi:hypothetical protein
MSQAGAGAGRNELERRYARLLLLYPADYRRSRGSELLATLMESTPDGRSRPALREVGPLVLGALRAHAGRRHNLRLTWLAAVHAAVVMLLLTDVLRGAVDITIDSWLPMSRWTPVERFLTIGALILGAIAVVATVLRRYRDATAAAVVAFAAGTTVAWTMTQAGHGGQWRFPLAIVLLLPLLLHRPPAVTGLLRYAAAVPVLLIAAEQGLTQLFPDVAGYLWRGAIVAVAVGSLLWLIVDERLAMAVGLLLLSTALQPLFFIFHADAMTAGVTTAGERQHGW